MVNSLPLSRCTPKHMNGFDRGKSCFTNVRSCSRRIRVLSAAALGIAFAVLGGGSSPLRTYSVRVPDGLAFSDFKGYENWRVVSVSQTQELLKVMVANPTMIQAYRAGVPGNGKPFPDGSKIAKIEWKPKTNTEWPFFVRVWTAYKTFSSSRRTAKNSLARRAGHMPHLITIREPTHISLIGPES